MQKQEIRSILRNILPKIDKDNRFHDNVINAVCEKVLAQMLNEVWQVAPYSLEKYVKQYGYTTPIVVSLEPTTGIYYSNLPEPIIPFGDNASGVRRISQIRGGGVTFFPMSFSQIDLVSNGSYFNTTTAKIGYAVNQTRIEYFKMTTAIANVGVKMDLIIPFSKYAETDEVKIPEVADLRTGETFFDRAIKILGLTPKVDLLDDNTSDVKQKDN
jgi:hypothetical protein